MSAVNDKRSYQSIKSLPVDFRYAGDQGVDRTMLLDTISENAEKLRDSSDGAANGRDHVGSDIDESPYGSLNVPAKDGASLADDGDDNKDTSTHVRPIKQPYTDSKWSDTTPYASKKVLWNCSTFLFFCLLVSVTHHEMGFLPYEAILCFCRCLFSHLLCHQTTSQVYLWSN